MKAKDIKLLEKALSKYREIAVLLSTVKDSTFESGDTVYTGGIYPKPVRASDLLRDMLRTAHYEGKNLERKIKLFSELQK